MGTTIGKRSGAFALLAALVSGFTYSGMALWSSPAHADACLGDDPGFCLTGWMLISRQIDHHLQVESCNYECKCGDGSSRFLNAACS